MSRRRLADLCCGVAGRGRGHRGGTGISPRREAAQAAGRKCEREQEEERHFVVRVSSEPSESVERFLQVGLWNASVVKGMPS